MSKAILVLGIVLGGSALAAEQPLKNIQVLKGASHDDVNVAMKVMSGALGVDCEHCHVQGFEKDDKQAKRTARKMITMTDAINHDFFGGEKVVSCVTCHQGHVEPRETLPLATVFREREPGEEPEEHEGKPPAPTVGVKDVLDHWLSATGGKGAWEKLRTRVATGKVLWGRPDQQLALDVTIAAPDHYLAHTMSPRGPFWQGFDGKVAWVKGGFGVFTMSPWDAADMARDGRLRAPLELAAAMTGWKVLPDRTIDKVPAHVLVAQANGCTERLFFDAKSGLLVRRIVTMPTRVGEMTEQIDYEDFKPVDGVTVPFTVRRNSMGEVQIEKYDSIKHNVPVDPKIFARPTGK